MDADAETAEQVSRLRAFTQANAFHTLEERLALGIDSVDVSNALLLGRCCRRLGDGDTRLIATREDAAYLWEDQVLKAGEGNNNEDEPRYPAWPLDRFPVKPPDVLHEADGQELVVPADDEFARLEGYHWERGGGANGRHTNVFQLNPFGSHGECIFSPTFCKVDAPETNAFLLGESLGAIGEDKGGGQRLPPEWLPAALAELFSRIRGSRRLELGAFIEAVQQAPSVVLVVPAALLRMKDDPSLSEFARKAARRHPLYVSAVEMGATLHLSAVPQCTSSGAGGKLDRTDADTLLRQTRARVFPVQGLRGNLCVRTYGGPPVDPFRLAGETLENVCHYLTLGWTYALSSNPSTWIRLSVRTARADQLENMLGPRPGRGRWAPLFSDDADDDALETDEWQCGFCGAEPVIGFEVPGLAAGVAELSTIDSTTTVKVCRGCSAFVPGSPHWRERQDLCQFTSACGDEVVGAADEGIDEALAVSTQPGHEDWADAALPAGAAVLAASGVLRLEPLPRDMKDEELKSDLAVDICKLCRCSANSVKIATIGKEAGPYDGSVVGFVLLHTSTARGNAFGAEDPRQPLTMFRLLASELKARIDTDSRKDGSLFKVKHLRPSGAMPIVLPTGLFVYVPPGGADFWTPLTTSGPSFQDEMAVLDNLIMRAKSTRNILRDGDRQITRELPDQLPTASLARSKTTGHGVALRSSGNIVGSELEQALEALKPSRDQLALRLRELSAAGFAERCDQLLLRWGGDNESYRATSVLSRDSTSFRGRSALDLAIAADDCATVERLLNFVPVDSVDTRIAEMLNGPNPVTGSTPLHAMASYVEMDRVNVARLLVRRRANPDGAGFVGANGSGLRETPLVAAVRRGGRPLVRALCELGADANACTLEGQPVLHVAVKGGDPSVVEILLSEKVGCRKNAVDGQGRTALVVALKEHNLKIAFALLDAQCDPDIRDRFGAAPILQMLSLQDAASLCRRLLERRADKDSMDPADGTHILHLAAQTRNVPLIQTLLEARANYTAVDQRSGRVLLHQAASCHMPSVARLLLDLRAEVDQPNSIGDTPLRLAVQGRDLEMVELLCCSQADPNIANRAGCAPIHAAVSIGQTQLTELLVKYKADIHLADRRLWRPLHYGAANGNNGVIEFLLDREANPDAQSYLGRTPLQLRRGPEANSVLHPTPGPGSSGPNSARTFRPQALATQKKRAQVTAGAVLGLPNVFRTWGTMPLSPTLTQTELLPHPGSGTSTAPPLSSRSVAARPESKASGVTGSDRSAVVAADGAVSKGKNHTKGPCAVKDLRSERPKQKVGKERTPLPQPEGSAWRLAASAQMEPLVVGIEDAERLNKGRSAQEALHGR